MGHGPEELASPNTGLSVPTWISSSPEHVMHANKLAVLEKTTGGASRKTFTHYRGLRGYSTLADKMQREI